MQKLYDWQRAFKKSSASCQLKDEKELAQLKARIVSLTEENLRQKKLLGSPLPKNWQFLNAKVIGIGNEILTINVGREDGVRGGMVAVDGTTYVGKVKHLTERMAQISLPTSLDEKLAVKIVSSTDGNLVVGRGLTVGRGQGKMKVEQILSSEVVEKGCLVLVMVEEGDLLVGEIEEVVEQKGEVFKTASIKRLFNPDELETIFLIRGKI